MCDLMAARETLDAPQWLILPASKIEGSVVALLRYPTRSGNIRYVIEHLGEGVDDGNFLFGTQMWTLGLVSTDHAFTSLLVPIIYHFRPPTFLHPPFARSFVDARKDR